MKCRSLREAKAGWLSRLGIGGAPPQTAAIDAAMDHLGTFANKSLESEALSAALQVLGKLANNADHGSVSAKLRQWGQIVQNWQEHKEEAKKKLEEWASVTVTQKHVQGYTLEWLAMLSRDFEEFYKRLSVPQDDISAKR